MRKQKVVKFFKTFTMAYRRTKRSYKKSYKKKYSKKYAKNKKYARKKYYGAKSYKKYSKKYYKKASVLRMPTKTLIVPSIDKEKLFSAMPDVKYTADSIYELAGKVAADLLVAQKTRQTTDALILNEIKTVLEPGIAAENKKRRT